VFRGIFPDQIALRAKSLANSPLVEVFSQSPQERDPGRMDTSHQSRREDKRCLASALLCGIFVFELALATPAAYAGMGGMGAGGAGGATGAAGGAAGSAGGGAGGVSGSAGVGGGGATGSAGGPAGGGGGAAGGGSGGGAGTSHPFNQTQSYRALVPPDFTTCAKGQVWDRKRQRCLQRFSRLLPARHSSNLPPRSAHS
jgi:hypothetical protein